MTEDERVRWHRRLNGREFEQAPGDSGGQESLVGCNPWVPESDTTYQLNNNDGKGRVCLMNSTEDRCFLTG